MEYIKLKEIATFPTGKLNSNAAVEDGKYPFFTCSHDIYRIDSFSYDGEYVLLGGNNASGDFPIFYYQGKFDAYQRTYMIRPKRPKEFLTKYLFYGISLRLLQMKGNAAGTATKFLTQPILQNIYIEKRNIQNQEKIVSILSVYDNLIEANNKRIKLLEQMAENLYKEWFVRFRFPGHETVEFENGLPKGWEYSTIESLSNILQRGISPEYDDEGDLTVISQKCIRQTIMDIREARKQTKQYRDELNLQDGDTVICSTGTGTLGRVGQVYGDYPKTTFDSHVTLVRAKQDAGKHYLFWTLKNMEAWFMNMGIGSTNQQELYRNTIKNAKAIKPKKEIVELFERTIEPIHNDIVFLIHSQENLTKQRDLLLPRLMSGKLEASMEETKNG